MDGNTGDAVSWLLSSAEPAIRLLTRRDLLGEKVADTGEILDGAMVRACHARLACYGVMAMAPGLWPTLIGGSAVLVAVRIGITVPEMKSVT